MLQSFSDNQCLSCLCPSSYREIAAASYTPNSSSLSPESSCLQSPVSYTWESPSPCPQGHHRVYSGGGGHNSSMETRSPPGTAADLQEFLQVRDVFLFKMHSWRSHWQHALYNTPAFVFPP